MTNLVIAVVVLLLFLGILGWIDYKIQKLATKHALQEFNSQKIDHD
jgi:hypothetical protein